MVRLPLPIFRPARNTALAVALAMLAACNGSVYLTDGDAYDARPMVSIAASSDSVTTPQTVTLVAAASDDDGVRNVAFFSLANNVSTQIGLVTTDPFRISINLDRNSNGTQYYFARATDDSGQTADSALVAVNVAIP